MPLNDDDFANLGSGAKPLSDDAFASLGASKAAPTGWVDTAKQYISDAAKSLPLGAVRSIASQAAGLGAADLGAAGYTVDQMPTPAQVQGTIEKHLTGPLHQPETTAGKVAATGAGFAVDPLAYLGPGALPVKAGRALVAGAGSEMAGQATEGTNWELPARIAGAVAADPGTLANLRRTPEHLPTNEQLFAAADQSYTAVRGLGVELRRQPVSNLADRIVADLETDGFRQRNAPNTWAGIRELRNPAGRHVTIDDIDSVRRTLLLERNNFTNGNEREAARRAVAMIDNELPNIYSNRANVAVNPHFAGRVADEMQNARGNWAAGRRAEDITGDIDSIAERAERQTARAGYGANINNAIRQQASRILNNPRLRRGFSEDELAQMEQVVRGTRTGNAARTVEHLLRPNSITTPFHLLGAWYNPYILGLGATGLAARGAANASTQRQLRLLDEAVRRRSPFYNATPQPGAQQPWLFGDVASPFFTSPFSGTTP